MKRIAAVLLLFAACRGEETKPFLAEETDTREPIGTYYVTGPELPLRQKPDTAAAVITTFQNGEKVSVLAQQGEWAEVRTGDRSGWARMADLGTAQAAAQEAGTPTARFVKTPSPVTNLTTKGEIYIEADVNTDGDVVNTRIIHNTTGSDGLAAQNAAALKLAKLYPILKNGARQPFKYYHRVTY